MIYTLAMVLIVHICAIIAVVILAILGKPVAFAATIGGIAGAAVVALFQFWPF